MAKYKCNNKKCVNLDKIIEEHEEWKRFKGEKIIDMVAPCPKCKEVREMIEDSPKREGLCINAFGGNGNICNK